jgi:hypothetical protein
MNFFNEHLLHLIVLIANHASKHPHELPDQIIKEPRMPLGLCFVSLNVSAEEEAHSIESDQLVNSILL